VAIETIEPCTPQQARDILAASPGIVVLDDPANAMYPTPRHSEQRDEVFVGRVRQDASVAHGLLLWVVADNLRKGAATNAVQIAEYLTAHA
jgi:aspartate-semialdehyde dehydrogenase